MKTRMQPVGVIWNKLPRVIRDLAASLGKMITLELNGADTELDRGIIEAIKDPLTHIVRNSCDHGIELPDERAKCGKPSEGRLILRAYHESCKVNIEVSDDGAGIDPNKLRIKAVERGLISAEQADQMSDQDALNMIFLPGFSTAKVVTNISGRGVGMDVVKTNIEKIGGNVTLVSSPGRGTSVRVMIPLTLAIIPGLIVKAGGQRFVIPQVNLHEVIWLEGDEVQSRLEYVHTTQVFRQRDGLLPLADLSTMLGMPAAKRSGELCIVILQAEGRRFGLLVDSVSDTEEIVVKPLGPLFENTHCYAGATIMGDGSIALILDANGIGIRSGILGGHSDQPDENRSEAVVAEGANPVSLLLVRGGSFPRVAIPISQVARLEQIPRTSIERAAGRRAVQYRNQILPLVFLTEIVGSEELGAAEPEVIEVVVCKRGAATVGLVVDEVIDAVEEVVESPCGERGSGLLGSAIVSGQVTDLEYGCRISIGPPYGFRTITLNLQFSP